MIMLNNLNRCLLHQNINRLKKLRHKKGKYNTQKRNHYLMTLSIKQKRTNSQELEDTMLRKPLRRLRKLIKNCQRKKYM